MIDEEPALAVRLRMPTETAGETSPTPDNLLPLTASDPRTFYGQAEPGWHDVFEGVPATRDTGWMQSGCTVTAVAPQ